jgi:DNA/RNA-binding domain of Phe-tRNA-synthetase-like protein
MSFNISKEVLDLGVNVAIVVIKGMKNVKENIDFNNYKDEVLNKVKVNLSEEIINNDETLKGFWTLHERIGKTSKKDMSSPENLLNMLLINGSIPSINLIVDIYNLVSAETKLALGAHDLDKINGNVSLRLTDGTENFLPIGYSKPKPISKGEYSYIDDNNDILCRMEVRQVEKTKVLETTTSCMYIVQGNENTSNEQIKEAVDMLIDLTKKYCGGTAEIIYKQY